MSDLESMSLSSTIPHRVFQVSTHGHDRVVVAPPFLMKWAPFAKSGVKHRDSVRIGPGETFEFPEMAGPGCIVNIWFTFMPYSIIEMARHQRPSQARKRLRIKIYFDAEQEPGVDAPVGDFFGVGFGEYKEYRSKYLEETSGGYVCRFPMPFKHIARVTITNTDSKRAIGAFYGAITYKRYDAPLDHEPFYFHALYREEMPTREAIPYKMLDVKGEGFYAGIVLNVSNARRGDGFTFLEANTKFFVDGEATPSVEYTGCEDYYQGAWYYMNGEYSAMYSGLTVRSLNKGGGVSAFLNATPLINKTSQYRFHEHDAIPFKKSLLAFIHHGEFDEVPTMESSVTYFYARHPAKINMAPLQEGEFLDEYHPKGTQ